MSHLQAQSPRTITEVKATSDESSLLLEEDLQLLPFQVDSTIHIIVFLKGIINSTRTGSKLDYKLGINRIKRSSVSHISYTIATCMN